MRGSFFVCIVHHQWMIGVVYALLKKIKIKGKVIEEDGGDLTRMMNNDE